MPAQPRVLGRGLGALIPSASTISRTQSDGRPLQVSIDKIRPREDQPRQHFDEHAIRQLATSIREQGILQPLVVSPVDGGFYDLIAGERRLRASTLAGLTEVPVFVRAAPADQVFELALIENIQRQDLNAIEEAEAYRRLMDEHGYTQEALSRRVGKDRATVANGLRLLRLRTPLRMRLLAGQLSAGHARALLGTDDATLQDQIAARIESEGLSVRAVERLVKESRGDTPRPRKTKPADPLARERLALGGRLERTLGRSVRIRAQGDGGTVTLKYASIADLKGLISQLAAQA
ncbi:MAG: ParB family chromosome partitioning protein [Myxococcota bacterium]|jgi:ParB family chromosome partitioning protein